MTARRFRVGDRVRALYPNSTWGEGTITEIVEKRGMKPYVVTRDDGTVGYFHETTGRRTNRIPMLELVS